MALPTAKRWFDGVNIRYEPMPDTIHHQHSWDLARNADGLRFAISVEVECKHITDTGPVLAIAKELVTKKMAELRAELALLKECKLDVTNLRAMCGKTVCGLVINEEKLPLE